MRWAAAMQSELLTLPWPEAVLQWGACAEEVDGSGKPVWRGLRVRMGIAWGGATYRKPLNTGEWVGPIVSSNGGMCACSAGCLMRGADRKARQQAGGTPLGHAPVRQLVRQGEWVAAVRYEGLLSRLKAPFGHFLRPQQ